MRLLKAPALVGSREALARFTPAVPALATAVALRKATASTRPAIAAAFPFLWRRGALRTRLVRTGLGGQIAFRRIGCAFAGGRFLGLSLDWLSFRPFRFVSNGRFGNAAQSRNGFTAALRGWLEALDARAFQEEQSASQFLTGGLVLLQGLMIGLLAFGFFHLLVSLIEEAAK
jgi:hypothetical protein